MSREVRHDGSGGFEIRFPFDRALVDLIKTLPNRRWNAGSRFWTVPDVDAVRLVDMLQPHRFRFDEPTRKLYVALGGALTLEADLPETALPRMASLFDDDGEAPAAPAADDYTVSGLNREVRRVLETAFPGPVWIVGEISGFNRNTHKRIVSFQLDERDETGKTVSSVQATLFPDERLAIEEELRRAGDPFTLEDEVTVRARVRIELYVPWGSYRVVLERIDVSYTLGEAARRREEILRRLAEDGLVGKNRSLPLPRLPLRVGLITSLGSDAFNDVRRTLEESGFAFDVTAHGARVQGHATEPSVLNALDYFRARAERLDVLLICRGGGSRTDLAWFDSEALARELASFPVPVIVGIGHEQDHSVLDEIGRRAKTPTAAAALVVDRVRETHEAVVVNGRAILRGAAEMLRDEAARGMERARRLIRETGREVQREALLLDQRRRRIRRAGIAATATARERLRRYATTLPRAAGARVGQESRDLERFRNDLGKRAKEVLARERERLEFRARSLRSADPRRVLERGYALLRTEDGALLRRADDAPAGTFLRASLGRGTLRLRSEGAEAENEA